MLAWGHGTQAYLPVLEVQNQPRNVFRVHQLKTSPKRESFF